jgi:hypothetical protein
MKKKPTLWLTFLISHQAAFDDFMQYVEGKELFLAKKIAKAAKDGDLSEMQVRGIEMSLYAELGQKIKAEQRELVSQNFEERKG